MYLFLILIGLLALHFVLAGVFTFGEKNKWSIFGS